MPGFKLNIKRLNHQTLKRFSPHIPVAQLDKMWWNVSSKSMKIKTSQRINLMGQFTNGNKDVQQ